MRVDDRGAESRARAAEQPALALAIAAARAIDGDERSAATRRLRVDRARDPLAARARLARAAAARGRAPLAITGDALELLSGYRWPGNVRELAAVLERAVDLATGDAISARELPPDLAGALEATNRFALRGARRAFEADLIRRALRATAGNRTRAARLLEISHRALLYKLKELAISD